MNIIGYGYVGKSLGKLFELNGLVYQVCDPVFKEGQFIYYDAEHLHQMVKYSEECLNDNNSTNYYFISVPTPSDPITGKCETKIVSSIIEKLLKFVTKKTTIVIKSTISPGTLDSIYYIVKDKEYIDVVFCPEFLRESFCIEDTLNSRHSIIGIPKKCPNTKRLTDELSILYKSILYPSVLDFKVYVRPGTICELFKYTINCFLAVKVWYFNEINEVCEKMNVEYSALQEIFPLEPRLGSSHTDVPGHDGKYGFGLGCLPKETKALTQLQKELDIPNTILQEITYRNENYFRQKSTK